MHCDLSFEVKRDDWRQTVSCFVRITTVNTSIAPRTCRAGAHRTLFLGIRKGSISGSRSSYGNSSGALPGWVSSSLRRFDRSHWTLAWAFVTEHLSESTSPPPRCTTIEISGASHWHPQALEQALSRLATPGKPLTAVYAPSIELSMPSPDQSCPSSAAWSLLTTLPVRGPYSWELFFKLWKLKLIFQRYIFLQISRFWQ